MGLAEKLYGSGGKGVYEIALAEWNYQNNNCFQALVLVTGTIPLMEQKVPLGRLGFFDVIQLGEGENQLGEPVSGAEFELMRYQHATSIGRTTAGTIGRRKGNLRKDGI